MQQSNTEQRMAERIEKARENETEEQARAQVAQTGSVMLVIEQISSEHEALAYMHKMTHQKVRAEEKWGAIPMDATNIAAVKAAVTANNWKHKDTLLQIIARWEAGDFSQAHHDHNAIWKMQNGSIGIAYGLLTAEEEEQFKQNNF